MTKASTSIPSRRLTLMLIALTGVLSLAGCANTGPPKPPSLHLPALVTDLAAQRSGDTVVLRWTTPSRTTDDLDIPAGSKGAMEAELCRQIGNRSPTALAGQNFRCSPILHLAVAPGASSVTDDLPPELRRAPATLLTYRVRIANSSGRSAGESTAAAFAASGPAPPAVDSLQASASQAGAVLEWESSTGLDSSGWTVELTRSEILPSGQPVPPQKSKPTPQPRPGRRSPRFVPKPDAPHSDELRLRTPDVPAKGGDSATTHGASDPTAVFGKTYQYRAERVQTLTLGREILEVRSAPSPAATVLMRDTFPPGSPRGLVAVPSVQISAPAGRKVAIDLSWEPNSEADLAGYFVYRLLARSDGSPDGPFTRLTPAIISAPAYRDVAVTPGQRYIYQVTAVDAAGNESAPSPKAQEVADSP